jgi:hypothetical protein
LCDGVLILPACTYAGSFTSFVTDWTDEDNMEREGVCNHITWKKIQKKKGKSTIQAFLGSIDEAGRVMKKEEEGKRSK